MAVTLSAIGAVWLTGAAAVLPNGTALTWYTAFETLFNSVYEPVYVWFSKVNTASLLANPIPLGTLKLTDVTICDEKLALTALQMGPRSVPSGTMTRSSSRQPCASKGAAVGERVTFSAGGGVGIRIVGSVEPVGKPSDVPLIGGLVALDVASVGIAVGNPVGIEVTG